MSPYLKKTDPATLPVVVLRNSVLFPTATLNFEISDEESAKSLRYANIQDPYVFLTAYDEEQEREDGAEFPFYRTGTVAKIKQMLRVPEGQPRVLVEGFVRASVIEFRRTDACLMADVLLQETISDDELDAEGEAYVNELLSLLEQSARHLPANTDDVMKAARAINEPGMLADFVAMHLFARLHDKQEILECIDPYERAEVALEILTLQFSILTEEEKIRSRVNARMSRHQKEFYLREQIKVIQEELGEGSDVEEFAERIREAELPEEVEAKLLKENDRLAKTPFGSAEATVIANYLDTCLEIPWKKATRDRVQFATVQKVLDNDHYGLEKVKERIVEYIAAKQLNPELRNQIICLVGPPGVGKTSIASSIARAMNRKYVRISLGGVRDEADIRGHRKTYIAAMPGRVITAVIQSGVRNPLILLDEIDKLSRDSHGDPTSALLEVLDGEQNKTFRDHFVELPFDLSDCMFIATANSLSSIPRPLIDRMEIIELGAYTKSEKLAIAKHHLLSKQLLRHGLSRKTLKLTDGALEELTDYYTHEAGVRNLERAIAALCRKAGKRMLAEDRRRIVIDTADVAGYLGCRKYLPETVEAEDEVGCVNGLAYTELGGTLLKVEVAVLEGTGKIETTGSLGDVMKESARIAVSYVRSVAQKYDIPSDFYKTKDIHIHFPEGAVPKDGPSAGVTMVTALISALTNRPVHHYVAMTGEISLRGKVLAIGGLKEKTMAAYNAGVSTVLIPRDNLRDLEDLDPTVREHLKLIPCTHLEDVLLHALLPTPAPKKAAEEEPIATAAFAPVNLPSQGSIGQVRLSEG